MTEFRVACELVRNGVIGKIDRVDASFGDPGRAHAIRRRSWNPASTGTAGAGPAPLVPYSSVLSPRGMHNHFPHWRH